MLKSNKPSLKPIAFAMTATLVVAIAFGCSAKKETSTDKKPPVSSQMIDPGANIPVDKKEDSATSENKARSAEIEKLKFQIQDLEKLASERKGFFASLGNGADKISDEIRNKAVTESMNAYHKLMEMKRTFVEYKDRINEYNGKKINELSDEASSILKQEEDGLKAAAEYSADAHQTYIEYRKHMDAFYGRKINDILSSIDSAIEMEKQGLTAALEYSNDGLKAAGRGCEIAYNKTLGGLSVVIKTAEYLPGALVKTVPETLSDYSASAEQCGRDCADKMLVGVEKVEALISKTEIFVNQKRDALLDLNQKMVESVEGSVNRISRATLDKVLDSYESSVAAVESASRAVAEAPEQFRAALNKRMDAMSQKLASMQKRVHSSLVSAYDSVTKPIVEPLAEAERGANQVTLDSYGHEFQETYVNPIVDPIVDGAKSLGGWIADKWHSTLNGASEGLDSMRTDKPVGK